MRVLGLIPARGGSKGIVGKNLYPIAGIPLIGYTINAAIRSDKLSQVVVSTDDNEIARVAKSFHAKVPFMRPAKFSSDHSSALDVVNHAIENLAKQDRQFDLIVYLQPTSPLRTTESIDQAIAMMLDRKADSLVSVVRVPHHFSVDSQMVEQNGLLRPFLSARSEQSPTGGLGPLRRQDKPSYFARNGPAILITRPETLARYGSLYGDTILPFEMDTIESLDIDGPDDLWLLQQRLAQRNCKEQ